MKAAAVLALFVAASSALTEVEYQNAFTNWMQQYQKSYTSDEFQARFVIFKQNLDFVNEWNAQSSSTVLAINQFADISNEEYKRLYLGTKINKPNVPVLNAKQVVQDLPPSVDWVQAGAVTEVKNQGQCGSCWSFSTTGGIEGAHFIATKNLVSCSEAQLVDCSTKYGNQGCNGGLMDNAFKYVIANKGIDSEKSYPYTPADGKCKFDKANVVATISKFTDIPQGDENALKTAVVQQPVSVAIDASHSSFQFYSSGVYSETQCSSTSLDHGVLAVGYGTDNGSDYWIVKNSWGATWGNKGYIWMSRNKNNQCGIATAASYPTA